MRTLTKATWLISQVNNASGSNVRLDTIVPISPYWQSPTLEIGDRSESTILPNQSVRLRLLVRTPTDEQAGSDDLDLMQEEVISRLGMLVQTKTLPESDLVHRSPNLDLPTDVLAPYANSRARWRRRYLESSFPAITSSQTANIFPLYDPLDLDIAVRYTILPDRIPDVAIEGQADTASSRSGIAFIHGLRPAPAFSLVEGLRRQVELDLESGNKSVRTMYEETGRIRRVMVDSILDGVLAREEDPVVASWSRSPPHGAEGGDSDDQSRKEGVQAVQLALRNASPALAVRWVLRLLPEPAG